MLSSIGPMELIVVLVIALVVLGPKRLPDAGRRSAAACASSRARSPAAATRSRRARDARCAEAPRAARRAAAARASPPERTPRMATFPLRAVGHHDQLTLTGHLGELRTRLIVCAVALDGALRRLPVAEPRAARRAQPAAGHAWHGQRHAGRAHGARRRSRGARRAAAQAFDAALALDDPERAPIARAAGAAAASLAAAAHDLAASGGRSRSRSASASRSRPRSPSPSPSRCSSVCRCCCGRPGGSSRPPSRRPTGARLRPLLALAPALFLAGVVFAYALVLPPAVRFLQGFNHGAFDALVQARDYYRFELTTMLALGAIFQLPVVMLVLGRAGSWAPRRCAPSGATPSSRSPPSPPRCPAPTR